MKLHAHPYLLAASVAAALVSTAPEARADDGSKRVCIDSHLEGQRLRDSGKLKGARQHFLKCAVEACPSPLRKDCMQWLDETDAAMPTLLIRARRPDGQDAADVGVLVDGESVMSRLTGMPFPVDPGEHVLRFVLGDGSTHEERVVITAGEKNRRVVVDFAATPAEQPPRGSPPPPPSPSPSPSPKAVPASVYVLGAVGVLAIGSFTFFGVRALTRGDDLKETCAPACSGGDASAVHREALIADISLAVGVAALGVATWILLEHRASSSAVVVAPGPHGSSVGWHTRF